MFLPPATAKLPGTPWFLGLDLAQRQDFTALAMLNLTWRKAERCPVTWQWNRKPELALCGLDRYPRGESYRSYCINVERRVDQILAREPGATVHLVIDASGPGAPIVDEFRRAGLDITIHPVTMTGGAEPSANKHGGQNVPRRDLITKLILLMEHQTFRAEPGIPNLKEFESEMLDLRANDTATSTTDDLVVAASLAAWQAVAINPELLPTRERRRAYIASGTRRLL